MKKSGTSNLTKLTLALSSLICVSAYGQSNQFPSDGSANSFNSALPQTTKNTAQQTHDLAVSYANFLTTSLTLTQTQAAGAVGNLMQESGGAIVHNPDVSDVAGNVGCDGKVQNITVNDGTRTIGNNTTTGAYQYATQDTDPNQATNPMNMALDPSNTYHIVFSE